MGKLQFKLLILAVLLAATALSLVFLRSGKSQIPVPSLASTSVEATPDPSMTTTIVSPDGKASLIMKESKAGEGKEMVFSVKKEGTVRVIFSKILSSGDIISIPFNTFSPDNKYVFLKELNQDQASYLVFTTSGEPIAQDTQYFEIVSKFGQKEPDYKITDVTGWGGINLVLINTDKAEGGTGPSFWFDVPSGTFIKLSNRFN